ncbi:hypothetical protein BVC80_1429g3 [Macleaya cordata]|uniref:Uncharacterized protein n=1 Tax=Macleaya cordata TaxID=56857 RepID=A0A200Q5C5_MACCD|nr:hypothetical protein BVC80_1429g3 [Macleaya cordata]
MEMIKGVNQDRAWNLGLEREMEEEEINMVSEFMADIGDQTRFSEDMADEDEWSWIVDPKEKFSLLGVSWVTPTSIKVFLETWKKKKIGPQRKDFLLFCLPFAIWATLWRERNERVFEGKENNFDKIIIAVKAILYN